MIFHIFLEVFLYLAIVLLLARPLGLYINNVYAGNFNWFAQRICRSERFIYRLCGVRAEQEMSWQEYATGVLSVGFVSFLILYGLQRLQYWLPLNPTHLPSVPPDLAFNTAISFVTNTNWQSYGGETTMSHFTQMLGLTVQNFISAATGMAVLMAFLRGIYRPTTNAIGNLWVDLLRGTLFILLPMSLIFALALASQGVVQTLAGRIESQTLQSYTTPSGDVIASQQIAVGPAASQIAIKQLGTNGGGFFNVNSAHPLENPTPLSNLLQLIAILLIPAALCFTFGEMVHDQRQAWAVLAAMVAILVPSLVIACAAELQPNYILTESSHDQTVSISQDMGNMEGKETRFGAVNSAIWAVATTAASNGSVNSMHDSFTPIGGLLPLLMIQLGEIIFGGVGSGLYGLLVFAILAVFIAGLMVGRTPEYLGKKIGAFEIKMSALVILCPCAMVLIGTAISVMLPAGRAAVLDPGPHGFTEILYALSSAANNNGSAFAGLNANSPFYNGLLGISMFVGRYCVMLPVIAMAGSMGNKKKVPVTNGTFPTHTPLFVLLLVGVILIVGALSFFPALALGPIIEHLQQ